MNKLITDTHPTLAKALCWQDKESIDLEQAVLEEAIQKCTVDVAEHDRVIDDSNGLFVKWNETAGEVERLKKELARQCSVNSSYPNAINKEVK